jgi:uncharacterized protein YndB with AHSA1/START domain
VSIDASIDKIWDALVRPEIIKRYMFGAQVTSSWKQGCPITWKGVWQGREYEDKGLILRFEPRSILEYSHYSPLSGLADTPGNYHTVTIMLARRGTHTMVSLSQDNNSTKEEKAHSEQNWKAMLASMKKILEGS